MATMPAMEVFASYESKHRKPDSSMTVRLRDDMQMLYLRAGLVEPHMPKHRAEVSS